MGFNSAFKGLKFVKNPGNGRLKNLNDPVLNVLIQLHIIEVHKYVYLLVREGEINEHTSIQWAT